MLSKQVQLGFTREQAKMVKFETQSNKMDIFDHHTLTDLNLDSVSKEQEELASTQAEVILH